MEKPTSTRTLFQEFCNRFQIAHFPAHPFLALISVLFLYLLQNDIYYHRMVCRRAFLEALKGYADAHVRHDTQGLHIQEKRCCLVRDVPRSRGAQGLCFQFLISIVFRRILKSF